MIKIQVKISFTYRLEMSSKIKNVILSSKKFYSMFLHNKLIFIL